MFQRSSRARKTHYLDDSDEEIIDEQIVDIIYYDHFPTLIERWGDDTKTRIHYDGDLKIEDFVEFEELEPTIKEEITYEVVMINGEIQSSRTISHFRSRSRNFRQLKKRRIKRRRPLRTEHNEVSSFVASVNDSPINERANQLLDQMIHLSHQIDSIVETNCTDEDRSLLDKHEVDSSLLSPPTQTDSITHTNESQPVLSIQSDSVATIETHSTNNVNDVIQSTSLDTNNSPTEPINIQSFPIHSNLPCNDYTRIFGSISNDVAHVIDDLTKRVDQTVSNQCESVHQRYDQLLDHLQGLERILSSVSQKSTEVDQQTLLTSLITQQAVNSLTFQDDYPWYINHYSIIDAENRFYQHFSSAKSTIEPSVDDDDVDGEPFQLVQRRKRVPSSSSSTTGKQGATVDNMKHTSSNISSNIDLTPVILHGHPIIPSTVSELPGEDPSKPIAVLPQTTKTKKKRRKKNSTSDEFFFEAPVPSVSDTAYTSMTSNIDHENSTSADASNTFPTSPMDDDPTQDTSFAASSIDESSLAESIPTTSSKKKKNKQKKKHQSTNETSAVQTIHPSTTEIVQEEPTPVIEEETVPSASAESTTTTTTTHLEDEHSSKGEESKPNRRRKKKSHGKPMDSPEQNTPPIDANESKLDLFLPNYIREQMKEASPSSNLINPKRRNRPRMLLKDREAKDLLTHEFDSSLSPTTKTMDEEDPLHQETSTDNILARGFRRWLEESHALTSSSLSKSTSGIQSLLIQPADMENDDEHDADQTNHSQRIPLMKPSFNAHSSHAIDYTSESLVEPTEDDLSSMNYDDWAYFLPDDDENRSVEHSCSYARACNDDTFLSDILPPNSETSAHSIDSQHRYGDFHLSRAPTAQISGSHQVKPSEIYRQWRRNLSQS